MLLQYHPQQLQQQQPLQQPRPHTAATAPRSHNVNCTTWFGMQHQRLWRRGDTWAVGYSRWAACVDVVSDGDAVTSTGDDVAARPCRFLVVLDEQRHGRDERARHHPAEDSPVEHRQPVSATRTRHKGTITHCRLIAQSLYATPSLWRRYSCVKRGWASLTCCQSDRPGGQ